MEKIRVELGERSYDIVIGAGILDQIGKALVAFNFTKVALVSNPTVFNLYGRQITDSLSGSGFVPVTVLIPDGEQYKDFVWAQYILSELLKAGLDRESAVVALGGGVIGDIACFSASLYMRGISCIQIPTTLLSQVDSSVGGKTGVNHSLGKNMIGTFYQPSLVWIDCDTLKTLPAREISAGMAEVIKYGIIKDSAFFDYLNRNRTEILSLQNGPISHIVKRSCEIKANIVSRDERESGLRAILNFGHTIGHALESVTGYTRYLHGEAVGIGMCYETELSRVLGLCASETLDVLCSINKAYGIPCGLPPDIALDAIVKAMQIDKKTISGKIKFILPEKVGAVRIINDVDKDNLASALRFKP